MEQKDFDEMMEIVIGMRTRKNLKQSNVSCNTLYCVSGKQIKNIADYGIKGI